MGTVSEDQNMRKSRCIKVICIAVFGIVLYYLYTFYSHTKVDLRHDVHLIHENEEKPKITQKAESYRTRYIPRPTHTPDLLKDEQLSEDVTIVTAYFNIGRFLKGEDGSTFFEPNLYRRWMQIFKRIRNPMIGYFDDKQDFDYFLKLRSGFPANLTVANLVKRDELWSFGLYTKIVKIISKTDYPKYHPNTVIPEYSSAMHAKYELMLKSTVENPFKTKHFCWLDIGLFRALTGQPGPPFHITIPPNFDPTKVAYTQVYKPFPEKLSLEQVFYTNLSWVCGCFFIGEVSVMIKWVQEYMRYAEEFLDLGFSNSDQQVLYAMFNRGHPKVAIRTYTSDGTFNEWFYLGYLCKSDILE